MDFTLELSALQGVMISADNVQPFSRLTAKGGNEEKINLVINNVLKFLKDENFINNDGLVMAKISKIRKFALYIILNSDLPVLERLVETEGIDLVIWTVPTIPKCLMCEMLWNLHMDMFVYEIIEFSYPQLGLEVASAFLDNFKYFNPTECLDKLNKLSTACYKLICRLQLFEMTDNELSQILSDAYNVLKKFLKYYPEPPHDIKLNSLDKDDLYMYHGECLHSALTFIYTCLEQFGTTHDRHSVDNIYKSTFKAGSVTKDSIHFHMNDNLNELILECVSNCHIIMLDMCKDLVMGINVDIFCAWSEFIDKGKSMQQKIGEFCNKLRTKLLSIRSLSEHPLVNMLEQISRKPVEMKDIINVTDTSEIIDKIDKGGEDKALWVHALVDKENLCNDINLVNIISLNLEAYHSEHCFRLYKKFRNHLNTSSNNSDIIELLTVKVYQKCSNSGKFKILEEHFSDKCFTDMKDSVEFHTMMTEVFNKLILSQDARLTDILCLFLQNPQKTFIKIFSLATENTQQKDIMIRAMKMLEKYSNHYYSTDTEPCVIKVTQKIIDDHLNTDSTQENFIKFMGGLKNLNIIPGSKLLLLIIFPNLHKALLNKDIGRVYLQLKLLKDLYTIEEQVEYRAPILAMIAKVVDIARWKINTFEALAPPTIQIALELQKSLWDTYGSTLPEFEEIWLKSKLNNLQALNVYYYRRLWNPPGENLVEVLSSTKVRNDIDKRQLTTWLSQIICSCTQQEWCEIWNSLLVFNNNIIINIMHDALSLVTIAEGEHRTDNSWKCLLYGYRNFVYVIRYKFFVEPLTDVQVSVIINIIAATANLIKKEDAKEIVTLLLPLFGYITEKKKDFSTCLKKRLENTSLAEMVNKVFANGNECASIDDE